MIEIVYIPETEILVEKDLLLIRDAIVRFGAKRVVIDPLSTFLYKIKDVQIAHEKIYQLTTLILGARAVGFMTADAPFDSGRISQLGIEEFLLDGVVILTASEVGFERQRFVEVYKLRHTDHKNGRYKMTIGRGGITVAPGKRTGKAKR
jgi:circadian clock protein KaiC